MDILIHNPGAAGFDARGELSLSEGLKDCH